MLLPALPPCGVCSLFMGQGVGQGGGAMGDELQVVVTMVMMMMMMTTTTMINTNNPNPPHISTPPPTQLAVATAQLHRYGSLSFDRTRKPQTSPTRARPASACALV